MPFIMSKEFVNFIDFFFKEQTFVFLDSLIVFLFSLSIFLYLIITISFLLQAFGLAFSSFSCSHGAKSGYDLRFFFIFNVGLYSCKFHAALPSPYPISFEILWFRFIDL